MPEVKITWCYTHPAEMLADIRSLKGKNCDALISQPSVETYVNSRPVKAKSFAL